MLYVWRSSGQNTSVVFSRENSYYGLRKTKNKKESRHQEEEIVRVRKAAPGMSRGVLFWSQRIVTISERSGKVLDYGTPDIYILHHLMAALPLNGGWELFPDISYYASPQPTRVRERMAMATCQFRLFEDVLPGNNQPVFLSSCNRALYIVEGDIMVETPTGCEHRQAGTAWLGADDIVMVPGRSGARVWRWELVPPNPESDGRLRSAPGATSQCKLQSEVQLDRQAGWLMRCDRVEFPKGGIAYTHVHQGPGIRCCLKGEITIEAAGHSAKYGPGEAWLELGYEPVLAPTTDREETAFVRCFILPRGVKNRSSIRYVYPEDAAKPKPQVYEIFAERFIELPHGCS